MPESVGQRGNNRRLLLSRQFCIDGKRENRIGGGFRVWKVSTAMSERREALLEMEWHRIVNLGADAPFIEKLPHAVPIWHANHVLIEDVTTTGGHRRQPNAIGQSGGFKQRRVT